MRVGGVRHLVQQPEQVRAQQRHLQAQLGVRVVLVRLHGQDVQDAHLQGGGVQVRLLRPAQLHAGEIEKMYAKCYGVVKNVQLIETHEYYQDRAVSKHWFYLMTCRQNNRMSSN